MCASRQRRRSSDVLPQPRSLQLTRMVHMARPADSEVAGLLALMLLIHARHRARTGPDGTLIPMAEQDRSVWDAGQIAEGVALVTGALPVGPTGPYPVSYTHLRAHET